MGLLVHECLDNLRWLVAMAHTHSDNAMLAGSVKLYHLMKLGSARVAQNYRHR